MWNDFGEIVVTTIEVGCVAWLAWSIIDDLWAALSDRKWVDRSSKVWRTPSITGEKRYS